MLNGSPPNFNDGMTQRTFVKVEYARHAIDVRSDLEARIRSSVYFRNSDRGTPILDVYLPQTAQPVVKLDDDPTELDFVEIDAPGTVTRYRCIDVHVEPGVLHRATLSYRARMAPPDSDATVYLAMDDAPTDTGDPFDGRAFLERYLPANLEFDQHRVDIDLTCPDALGPYAVFSNGSITRRGFASWEIRFPSSFTASCPFLYVAPERAVDVESFEVRPAGRGPIEVTVFGDGTTPPGGVTHHAVKAYQALLQLDGQLGPFPHDRLLLYSSTGGMEYAGAAQVSAGNVLHEIVHSYLGRGVLPANGSAGWLDEAVATWFEYQLPVLSGPPSEDAGVPGTAIGHLSPYERFTSPKAGKDIGMKLIGYLAGLLGRERLLECLQESVRLSSFRTISSTTFEEILWRLTGGDYKQLFLDYVYGGQRP